MEIKGKIIKVLPARSGESERGKWTVQSFVVETEGMYPKRMVAEVSGEERIARFGLAEGRKVTVFFDINAREYEGRWFNQVRAYDVRGAEDEMFPTLNPTEAAKLI